jgi:5S rRNA maturation endonuclease (ribonuclease M5)
MSAAVSTDRRFRNAASPCPVCGGWDSMPRGQGKRCSGFRSDDGEWIHCSREEHAGSLTLDGAGTYAHRAKGSCKCGTEHAPDYRAPRREPEAIYDYRDSDGSLLFQVVRFPGKQFKQRRPDGMGGWIWKLNGAKRVLYCLPDVLKLDAPIYLVEGEKDVETLRKLGLTATTTSGGADNWRHTAEHARQILAKRQVIIVRDKDAKGLKYATDAYETLHDVVCTIATLECPVAKDITDHIAAGGTLDQLIEMQREAPPACTNGVGPGPDDDDAREPEEAALRESEPKPLSEAAFHGLAGRIVRAIEPQTEAHPAALLIQLLVAFGNAIGKGPHCKADGSIHACNLFVAIVGKTSKGRKGTSWNRVREPFEAHAARDWARDRVTSGLSSGEGLIWAVRDAVYGKAYDKKQSAYVDVILHEAVTDKRLLVFEAELASAAAIMSGRSGNTLSPIVRDAWDRGFLQALTKNSKAKATGAHISIIGHITRDELLRTLNRSELGNGFANRFVWIFAKRARVLPFPEPVNTHDLAFELKDAIEAASKIDLVEWAAEARPLWVEVYGRLSAERPGVLGAVTARAEAQVMRLGCIYALLDGSHEIRPEHLRAALAIWEYSFETAAWVWGDSLGDPTADELLLILRAHPQGMSATAISAAFGNHGKEDLGRAKGVLLKSGLARCESIPTSGRPEERWYAVKRGNGQ